MKTISCIMIFLSLAMSQEASELSFSDENMGRLQRLLEMDRELNPIEEVTLLNLVLDAFSFLKEKTSQTDIGAGDDTGTPEQKLWTILSPHCGDGTQQILTSELATNAFNEFVKYRDDITVEEERDLEKVVSQSKRTRKH